MGDLIPKRLNCHAYGYDYEVGRALEVFVNGVKQNKVIAYDIEAGWVLRYKLTPEGKHILNAAMDAAVQEKIAGEVTVLSRNG